MQELIKFSLQGLRVSVFGALNNERHENRSQSGKAVPIERSPIKNELQHRINQQHTKRCRMRRQFSDFSQGPRNGTGPLVRRLPFV